jgi:hypothetical protein
MRTTALDIAGDASRRRRRAALLLPLAAALVLAQLLLGAANPAGACACGAFVDPPQQRTDAPVLEETAVLSLREGTETMIMGLHLDGTRTGSTLLLPTPSVPEVSAAESGILREMQAATAPREVVEYDLWGPNPFLAGAADGGAPTVGTAAPEVTVHEQSRIGDYEVAVLGGEAEGVRGWLEENGYDLRASVSELLDPYVEDGWVFTAVRYADDAELSGEVEPLRFDFETEELVYPMRFSQAALEDQVVHLFVLSDEPVRRTDDSASSQGSARPWIADPTAEGWDWSDATLRELIGVDATPREEQHRIVTEFEIEGAPETFTTDLTFTADPGAEHVVPTYTTTEVVTVLGVPVGWALVIASGAAVLALGLGGIAALVAVRSSRRR